MRLARVRTGASLESAEAQDGREADFSEQRFSTTEKRGRPPVARPPITSEDDGAYWTLIAKCSEICNPFGPGSSLNVSKY